MLLQSEIAGMGRRSLAMILDLVIVHLSLSVITRGMVLSPWGTWVVVFIIAVFYSGLLVGARGQSLGQMAVGVRVIAVGDFGLTYAQTFKRAVLKWLPIFGVFVLLAVLMPEELRNRGIQQDVIEQVEIDSGAALVSYVIFSGGLILWLFLLRSAKRHPDGQALHDRVVETYVIKTMHS